MKAMDPDLREIFQLLEKEQVDSIKMNKMCNRVKEEVTRRMKTITKKLSTKTWQTGRIEPSHKTKADNLYSNQMAEDYNWKNVRERGLKGLR